MNSFASSGGLIFASRSKKRARRLVQAHRRLPVADLRHRRGQVRDRDCRAAASIRGRSCLSPSRACRAALSRSSRRRRTAHGRLARRSTRLRSARTRCRSCPSALSTMKLMPARPPASSSASARKMTSRSSGTFRRCSSMKASRHADGHALVVRGAAAVDVAVLDRPAERIERPFLALDADDVGVAHEQERALLPVAFQPGDEVRASAGLPLEDLRRDPLFVENLLDERVGLRLVARRIARVDLHERGQRLRDLVARGVEIGRSGPRLSGDDEPDENARDGNAECGSHRAAILHAARPAKIALLVF